MVRQIVRVSKFWRAYAGELAVEARHDMREKAVPLQLKLGE
jgi:hypothetical protein